MLNEMKTLLKQQNMCVLATVGNRNPHCSLMAYVTNEQGDEIYLVTHKNSNISISSGSRHHSTINLACYPKHFKS
jgi:general stress protein 26